MISYKKFTRYPQALVMVVAVAAIGIAVVAVTRAAAPVGDLNGDGTVNVFDLSILLSEWGTTAATADINHDGSVTILDLSTLLSHWGETATPSPTPTPTPTPAQTINCVPNPHLCGFPDATNTGVPAGTQLTNSGSISVTTNGAVVDARNVSGTIEVHASNVTIKRTRVTTSSVYPIRFFSGFTNLTISDVEVAGSSGCLRAEEPEGSGVTMTRLNVHGCEDGVQMDTNESLTDSYIHDLVFSSSSHNDGVQQNGGSGDTVRHNTIFNPNNETSCVNFTTDFGGISNITIDDNLLDGGNYTVYSRSGGNGNPTGVKVTNNHFGRRYVFGLLSADGSVSESGNVWDNTGAAVTP